MSRVETQESEQRRKLKFLEDVAEYGGPVDFNQLIHVLQTVSRKAKAISTIKAYERENHVRRKWLSANHLPLDEKTTILYLAHRFLTTGSGSLAKIASAFQMANGTFSVLESQMVSDMIRAKRREEIATRQQPKMVELESIQKLFESLSDDPKSERDTLISREKWEDIKYSKNRLEVRIRSAKNDQLGLGRSTFVECPEGGDLDCLIKRWRVRVSLSESTSEFLFPSFQKGDTLSANTISSFARRRLEMIEVSATHHALRRGSANELQAKGLNLEQIKAKGRWRSGGGLMRYLQDNPMAQGLSEVPEEKEVTGEAEEDDGPPVLEEEV
ncbi:hypothetical protein L5515_000494 [Caenorhabditis briggsae]|uniref:Tyr recombinase domain-containing protein n=2 Tax=Caenorhabditis briggsae TaxID=6238 RepID=A0AAE9DZW7_CAEBR|nr:hypothetical protein L3Y34_014413 [Caenorhabditis briggsae]UMM10983.1 hypothetical protein L5515_000494 [Caenorhabditis briggsae]